MKQLYSQRNRWYKGGFLNLLKYRSMLFNPKYGHFGMYQMPVTLFGFFFAFLAMFFFSYFVIYPFGNTLYDLYLINFDIMPYINNANLTFNFLSLNLIQGIVILTSLLIGAVLFIISHRNAREIVRYRTMPYIVPYFLAYYLAIGFFCVMAVLDILLGEKKQKW